jgi:hypothetical protein
MGSRKLQAILSLGDDRQIILLLRKISTIKPDKEKVVNLFRPPFSNV